MALRLSLLWPRLNSAGDWLTPRRANKPRQVNLDMPGWESLETVTRLHGGAQVAGLILLALIAALALFVAYQLRNGAWPEWLDIGEYQLRSRFFEIACAAVLALLVAAEIAAYGYGIRRDTLQAAAEQASADRLRRLSSELQARRADSSHGRTLRENSELRQKLIAAENKIAELERAQSQKRLSQDQKRLLIQALKPFAGQKITVASISGDEEGQILAQDLVSVFDAAGWDHDGEAGVSTQQWDRDPIGIEVTLNEADARSGRISAGVGALINVVRQLGLVYDNTVYMNDEVPSGQAQLRVGKKLR
jgi:hypothetical protein